VREEDLVDTGGEQPEVGTPPRAWGGRLFLERARTRRGNTPTCVGRTNDQYGKTPEAQEHPHVRGEDRKRPALLYSTVHNWTVPVHIHPLPPL